MPRSGPDPPAAENPLRGIVLLVGATLLFSLSDAMSKYLGQLLPVVEISWIRYVTFVVLALGLVNGPGPRRLMVRSPTLHVVRGLGLVGSSVFYIYALRYLPMADAAAIGFISPLLITMLSVPMLGEVVGPHRWAATIVGLLGVLVIVRPGGGMLQFGAIFVVLSSLSWALAMVLTRRVAHVDDAATTLLWTAVSGLIVLCGLLPLEFRMPSGRELAVALCLGVVASSGQYVMVLAYRHAGASLLAPFSYVQLLWASLLGYLVFDAIPDQWTAVGAAIIVASGLYTAHRERRRGVAIARVP